MADTKAEALAGAQFVLDHFAKGREAGIRVLPEAASERAGLATIWRALVRFSYRTEPGNWRYAIQTSIVTSIGDAPITSGA